MNYTRGKAGPMRPLTLEVSTVEITEAGPNSRARGGGIATLAGGRLKAVEFLIQGGNLEAARDALVPGGELRADARWTGSTAVTLLNVQWARAGDGTVPVAAARRSGLAAQADALFR